MKIVSGDNRLVLERTGDRQFPYLRFSARIGLARGTFEGSNDGVFFGGGGQGLERFAAFRCFDAEEVLVDLTEDCYIWIKRFPRGNLLVTFQVAVISDGMPVSMKGAIEVEGEFGQQIVEELGQLIS